MRQFQLVVFMLLAGTAIAFAQVFKRNYHFKTSGNLVQDKNFYLFTLIQQDPAMVTNLVEQPALKNIYKQKKQLLDSLSLGLVKVPITGVLQRIKFSTRELNTVLTASSSAEWAEMVEKDLKPSGYFSRFENGSDADFIKNSLLQSISGLNRIVDTYGLGIKGRYPAIDSASYVTGSSAYQALVIKSVQKQGNGPKLFFEPLLQLALSLLELNKRDEAARFEPMAKSENQKAFEKMAGTDWSKYPYAAIIVPGNGPVGTEQLSKNGKMRLKLAVDRYNREMAPVIIVSGGNVHPFQTPYNEALEMKKELVKMYNIPESDILIEPHARHTTTNLRNCNRLIYRYPFPIGKKLLITTDKKQADKIAVPDFAKRCITEIGHQPFVGLARTSDFDIEYLPVMQSLHMDNIDPLDP